MGQSQSKAVNRPFQRQKNAHAYTAPCIAVKNMW